MTHAHDLVDKHFARRGGELLVEGVPIGEIVSRFGSPVFVYSRRVMERKLSLLRSALPPSFSVYYSMKANPNRAVIEYFLSEGCGIEIASGGELYQALRAGCGPANMLFAGPGKTRSELEYAIGSGIGEIHVESEEEAHLIAAIAYSANKIQKIAVRINPGEEAQGGAMRMGGKASAFGIDEENLSSILESIRQLKNINVSGVHLFTGTQILDDKILLNQYKKGIEIAQRVSDIIRKPIETVDFGGGLGIPYFQNDSELNIEKFGEELKTIISEITSSDTFSNTKFIIEPGRYLVGESGIYITRINYVKESRGKKFLILDGGMNHHLAASGNLGQVIKRNFPIAILNKLNAPMSENYDVAGPLCTPLDTLGRDVKLPKAEVGDIIGVLQSGAYARSASPLGFLSHPAPPEVMVHDGIARLIRKRAEYRDTVLDLIP